MYTYKKMFTTTLVLSVLAFNGCGGDDDDDKIMTDPTPTLTKGYLIDAPIEGASYTCGDITGTTSSTGEFECQNAPVTFSLGAYVLGTINAFTSDTKVFPQDLLGLSRTDFQTQALVEWVQLIQSFDNDNNVNNGIKILSTIISALSEAQSGMSIVELATLANVSLVDSTSAIAHLQEQITTNTETPTQDDVTPDETTPPNNATVDLTKYGFIYVYKNVTQGIADIWKDVYTGNEGFTLQEGAIDCSKLSGYTNVAAGNVEVAGIKTRYYSTADFKKFCYEIDYQSSSSGAGSSSITMFWSPVQ